ncbi:MAG: outer-membrane lipoprotein carrier protein LolA [Candidatus Aminicenantes bacterium]|nr:outer-membrane lipoprotein carrier protein LolA [Candidatus Aminicenantes bacterium]
MKPFQLQFVQQVYTDEELDIEESGEILFKDDRHLRWTYLKPDFKVFLLQEDDYKFYDEENRQLTVGKVNDRSRQWLWQLFFSDDILRYTYTTGTGGKKFFIKKPQPEEPLDIEILLNNDYLPVQVVQQDPNTGARMIFYFKDYKEKLPIPADAFELKVPKDVETVEENG